MVVFGGYATTSESAAIAALYALIVQRFVHRDLASFKAVVRVAGDCVALVGGVLVILAVAVGLTNYLVNAQVPTQLIEWTQSHIQSKGRSCSPSTCSCCWLEPSWTSSRRSSWWCR